MSALGGIITEAIVHHYGRDAFLERLGPTTRRNYGQDVKRRKHYDISIAIAMLISGVVHQRAREAIQARALVSAIRGLEDNFIARALNAKTFKLQ
jgi:hypothetical protein